MSKSMKAALLSGLVFPGAGHFFLKKHFVGVVLAGATCVSLYLLISKMVERALQIIEKIQPGEQLSVESIAELLATNSAGAETKLLGIASAVLIVAWIYGIIDSYRVGHKQDKAVVDEAR